jgi:hypothetical protein
MLKVAFGRDRGLLLSFFFHRPTSGFFDLIILSRLGLRWSNQDLLPLELDRVHVNLEQIFVELHLGIFSKFQSSFVYG